MRKEKLEELKELIEELKVIELTKTTNPSSFIKSEVYQCKINNGETIIREKLIKGKKDGSAAIIMPIIKDNNIILTVEPRVFTKKTVGISLPAGYIEPNELAVNAAKRELEEETGYVSNDFINLGGFYQDMGCSAAFNEMFIADNCSKVSGQKLDKDEFIKYFICTYHEALELIDLGYIQGCNSIITLNKAKAYMRRR